ncbi:MAG: hypothetical protein GW875_07230 [Deltaproteobacteria bacterium]|nr:hypothetical protein [Deltaproteobacteria bacterium]NCP02796.1 hypothetical protein [Deltaproteobacteria bacterium]
MAAKKEFRLKAKLTPKRHSLTVRHVMPPLIKFLSQSFCGQYFQRNEPDAVSVDSGHGCIETRKIWTSSELNHYLDFPHVGQAFVIERKVLIIKPGRFPLKPPTASPVARSNKPTPIKSSTPIATTGAFKTAATTSSARISMETAAGYVLAMGRRISHG